MVVMMNNTNTVAFVPADSIQIGDAIVEQDGYLLAVAAVARKGSLITFTLANDFSPIRAWRSDGANIALRKRASTRVAVVRGGGRDVVSGI